MTTFSQRLKSELTFTTSRSSGPGGQNVNKVNTRVSLRFDVVNSLFLTAEEKVTILQKLKTKLTNDGILILTSNQSRSQLQNKELVVDSFDALLKKVFTKPKKRTPTRRTRGSVEDRIKKKKQHAEKKQWRKRPED